MTYKVKITFPSHRVSCEYPARLKFDQNSLEIHHSKRTLSPSSRKSSWRTYTFNAHRGMIISLLARAFRLLAQSDNTEESWMLFFSLFYSPPSNTHSRIVEISRSNFIFFHCYFFSSLAWAALCCCLFVLSYILCLALFASFLIFRKWFLHAKTANSVENYSSISLLFLVLGCV